MQTQLISAIDIGSFKVATIIALVDLETDEIRIIGFNQTPSRGVRKGLIVDINKISEVIEKSVEGAERMAGKKIESAFISVGGPHINSINSQGVVATSNPNGEIVEEDVERVIEAARAISLSTTREIIEVSPREFIIDGQEGIKNPIGMSGVRLEVETHIITASTTNLKNIRRVLDDLGIDVDGFVFSGLASAMSTLTPTEKELGVVLVDIGGGKTDLAIYIEDALAYSSSIAIGSKHITNDIAVGLRTSLEEAESIKVKLSDNYNKILQKAKKHGFSKTSLSELKLTREKLDFSLKTLIDEFMTPRIEEIFNLIGEEIEKSGFGNEIKSGIVITGGGALVKPLTLIGKKILGLSIRIGSPSNITGLVEEILTPQFATTVGLISYGKENIMTEGQDRKDFNKILKNLNVDNTISRVKEFVKQFIP